ncbi:MAG: nickel-dependent lactate racemase [candidate division KSB1 bacterium]|nr:nickel-dependent lactate racemase [candidate division KSB1 bacterium]MDZ7274423.1 nickel-dependent lactate racemase [candidate division KSB1 bacterium]MDZ7284915.1 nickel-dependent lactate racemase [candidate division KSB1 bacterium]MDZ7297664.1 nickel-dependent lactate racemase [candidate division KSB1 bacterium]MDZ7305912.1 nickel-dependent lactate racemase [candidate division KSB1 bacterium]
MILKLKYGTGALQAEFRPPRQFVELKPKYVATLQKPEDLITQALDHPLGCHPFDEVFRGAGNVLLVVPDDVHSAGGALFLPVLLERLRRLGLAGRDITILVAGTWGARRNGVPNLVRSTTTRRDSPTVLYHDALDVHALEYAGRTRRGTPVFVNRLLLDFDRVILAGAVSLHPFAGYAGGPSLIVPDCAGAETIERLYGLALAAGGQGLHPLCRAGVVDGNPLQQDMREAFRFLTIDFLLHTILNDCGNLIGAVAGEALQAFAAGCHQVDDLYRIPISHPADLVIVSSGGAPHDHSFSEAHTALHNAMAAVRPGGVVILAAACDQDMTLKKNAGATAVPMPQRAAGAFLHQHHFREALEVSMRQKTAQARIILLSQLEAAAVGRLGFHPANSLAEALQLAFTWLPEAKSCYLLPNGAMTVPYLV